MPSLLAVSPVDHPGGAEIALLRLLPRLRHAGWDVTVTTPGDGPVRRAAESRGLRGAALPVGGLGRGEGARAAASWPAARRLARRHDVTYLNGTVCGRLLPAVPRDRRAVLHVHDMVDRVPAIWRRADVVLAGTPAVAERLTGLGDRVHVVGYPIEAAPRTVVPPWPPGDAPVVGYVGRIERRKGVQDLIAAAGRIRAAGARVVLIGDDPYDSDPEYFGQVRSSTGRRAVRLGRRRRRADGRARRPRPPVARRAVRNGARRGDERRDAGGRLARRRHPGADRGRRHRAGWCRHATRTRSPPRSSTCSSIVTRMGAAGRERAPPLARGRLRRPRDGVDRSVMRVAFDSRPASGPSGIARYTRSLRAALATEADRRGGEVVDAHRPRGVDVYHSPWIDGALLRPRGPMVVTLHDLIPLKRPGEYLRSGLRFRMRYLAVERATR